MNSLADMESVTDEDRLCVNRYNVFTPAGRSSGEPCGSKGRPLPERRYCSLPVPWELPLSTWRWSPLPPPRALQTLAFTLLTWHWPCTLVWCFLQVCDLPSLLGCADLEGGPGSHVPCSSLLLVENVCNTGTLVPGHQRWARPHLKGCYRPGLSFPRFIHLFTDCPGHSADESIMT